MFREIVSRDTILYQALKLGKPPEEVLSQALELERLLDGISSLLRKGPKGRQSVKSLVERARTASLIRFRSHRVSLDCPLLNDDQEDFEVSVPRQLFVGAIMNVLDNSFYWLRVRWPSRPDDSETTPRRIWIGRSDDFEKGPALVRGAALSRILGILAVEYSGRDRATREPGVSVMQADQ